MPSLRTARLPNRLRLLGQMTRTEDDLEQEARIARWQGKYPDREALRWWKKNGRTIRLPAWIHDAGRWDEHPDATSLDMYLENDEETGGGTGLRAIAVDGVEDEALGKAFWEGVLKRAKLSEWQMVCLRRAITDDGLSHREHNSAIVARRKIRQVLAEIADEERRLLA